MSVGTPRDTKMYETENARMPRPPPGPPTASKKARGSQPASVMAAIERDLLERLLALPRRQGAIDRGLRLGRRQPARCRAVAPVHQIGDVIALGQPARIAGNPADISLENPDTRTSRADGVEIDLLDRDVQATGGELVVHRAYPGNEGILLVLRGGLSETRCGRA